MADAKQETARKMVAEREALVASLDRDAFGAVDGLVDELAAGGGVAAEDANEAWIEGVAVRLAAVESRATALSLLAASQNDEETAAAARDGEEDAAEAAAGVGGAAAPAAAPAAAIGTLGTPNNWPLLESVFEASPLQHRIVRAGYEVLFSGNSEGHSLVTTVLDCLCRCHIDLRSALAQNIIIVGGGAATANLAFRLQEEIDAVVDKLFAAVTRSESKEAGEQQQPGDDTGGGGGGGDAQDNDNDNDEPPFGGRFELISCLKKHHGIRVRPLAPFNAAFAAWTGASVFASSSAFNRTASDPSDMVGTPGGLSGVRPGGACRVCVCVCVCVCV